MSKSNRPKREFTKAIIALVMATYFVGVAVGAFIVLFKAHDELAVWLSYIGTVAAVAVGFYSWKARAENTIKLKQLYGQDAVESEESGHA